MNLGDPAQGPQLSWDFCEALNFAAQMHLRQFRKGRPIPFVSHLLAVASLVLEYGGNEDEAIAALLHDAVEDQGGRPVLDRIRRRFGETVAEIVEGCTDSYTIPKPPWRERKESYICHLANASPSVLLVCTADKVHNARSLVRDYRELGNSLWSTFKGGREGTLWNYRALLEALRARSKSPLVDELEREVGKLENLVKAQSC